MTSPEEMFRGIYLSKYNAGIVSLVDFYMERRGQFSREEYLETKQEIADEVYKDMIAYAYSMNEVFKNKNITSDYSLYF